MSTITVCTTCRVPEKKDVTDEPPCGEAFIEHMRAAAAEVEGVSVRPVKCLMGCERSCNVALSAEGKLTYVLGRFEGTAEDAQAVVEYATGHRDSETGVVPFRTWPQGVKGHFVARIPPLSAPVEG
ncbi:DUF1636 family protein [Amaricoccus tamworthensis]|uniref:DUF1636 family protein n=1 Tax=Amaricoccus tamworthensis TaxID=57002 RepID=UPI003C7A10B9